ncbi:MAG: biotin synthase BioB [Candidatus Omnitrophota bacterium]
MEHVKPVDVISMPIAELLQAVAVARAAGPGNRVELCSVINAKSGRCGEDCKFCAQSAHHHAEVSEYPLKSAEEILKAAREAEKNGAEKFGIVTSGRALTSDEVKTVAGAISRITKEVGIAPCASLGALSRESFMILKEAGLTRYHHNIETSRRFYPSVVSTHDYDERLNTVRNAKEAGLEVCSGGIFGLGETWQDRIDMAEQLQELGVDAVPLNFLVPVKGTPMENASGVTSAEAVRIIALFRIVLKRAVIKVAAGRESVLRDFQGMMFAAGANGMMIGGYLTVAGRPVADDKAFINEVNKLWNAR